MTSAPNLSSIPFLFYYWLCSILVLPLPLALLCTLSVHSLPTQNGSTPETQVRILTGLLFQGYWENSV